MWRTPAATASRMKSPMLRGREPVGAQADAGHVDPGETVGRHPHEVQDGGHEGGRVHAGPPLGGRYPDPDARPGPAAARCRALRDLRLRPARAPPLRRARRRVARGRLRRLHALRPAGRVRPRVLRRDRRVRARVHAQAVPTGTPVVALPLLATRGGVHTIGLSAQAPGAYAEQVLVEESLMLPVPNGLAPELAALTEPMAVGWHAVRRGEVGKRRRGDRDRLRAGRARRDLHAQGARGADDRRQRLLPRPPRARATRAAPTSWSTRPRTRPTRRAADRGHLTTVPGRCELAVGTMEKLRRAAAAAGGTSGALAERLGAQAQGAR